MNYLQEGNQFDVRHALACRWDALKDALNKVKGSMSAEGAEEGSQGWSTKQSGVRNPWIALQKIT
jgi:hypothetical protein